MKSILLASTVFFAFASTALAADAVAVEPAPEAVLAPAFTWTGGYVGLQAGYSWGDANTNNFRSSGALLLQSNPDPNGTFGGIYAGYNYQFENGAVVGVDADFNWSAAKSGFEAGLDAAGAPFPPNQHSVGLDAFGSVRARIGYGIDQFHPYVAAGVAIAKASLVYDHANDDAVIDDTMTGWTVGGGLEYAATDSLILRTEYRYTDYGSGSANAFPHFPTETQKYDLTTHDVRLGIAYKF